MRRLVALILALLLPCAALGEAMKTEITLSVDEERYAQLIAPAVTAAFGTDEEQTAQLAMLAAKLMNGMGVRVTAQEDAASIDLLAGGKKLIDAKIHLTEDGAAVITSDLMRGYGLVLPLGLEEPSAVLAEADWESVLSGMLTAGLESMAHIRHTFAQGSFAGDAYQGGVYCDAYTLDDSDVAALLSSMMTAEFREETKAVLDGLQLDGEALLAEVDALHERVAEDNAYAYVVRVVRDAAQEPVGLSLTVMQGAAQLATLSVGRTENTLRIVFGYGDATENHWYDHVITLDGNRLSGEAVTFSAPKEAAFSYASAMMQELSSLRNWSAEIQWDENRLSWQYEDERHFTGDEATGGIFCTGNIENGLLNGSLQALADGAAYEALTVSMQAAEALAPLQEELKLCDVTSTDEEQIALLYEIADLAEQMLTMRMMLILPMDALTNLPGLME